MVNTESARAGTRPFATTTAKAGSGKNHNKRESNMEILRGSRNLQSSSTECLLVAKGKKVIIQ